MRKMTTKTELSHVRKLLSGTDQDLQSILTTLENKLVVRNDDGTLSTNITKAALADYLNPNTDALARDLILTQFGMRQGGWSEKPHKLIVVKTVLIAPATVARPIKQAEYYGLPGETMEYGAQR